MKTKEILALMFTAEMIAMIGVENLKAVALLNSQDSANPNVCHSHDFCDANVAMFDAWQRLYPNREDIDLDEINAAWREAKLAWSHI